MLQCLESTEGFNVDRKSTTNTLQSGFTCKTRETMFYTTFPFLHRFIFSISRCSLLGLWSTEHLLICSGSDRCFKMQPCFALFPDSSSSLVSQHCAHVPKAENLAFFGVRDGERLGLSSFPALVE